MRTLSSLFALFIIALIYSCNDGDVLEVEFDFNDTYQACGDGELLLYKTKNDPSETLTVLISGFTSDELFTSEEDIIEKTNVDFNYRTYANTQLPNDLFCTNIPPDVNITNDQSSKCTATFFRTIVEDDNDGIPTELESTSRTMNPLADDDDDGILNYLDDDPKDSSVGDEIEKISKEFDTDQDGLPNFIDEDDDGDNVPTINEDPIKDADDNPLPLEEQDTDDDGIPNYLDNDDDGDGILTRDEENETQDQNPRNDQAFGTTPNYLNATPTSNVAPKATRYMDHKYTRSYTFRLVITNLSLNTLFQDEFNFGTLTGSLPGTNDKLNPPIELDGEKELNFE